MAPFDQLPKENVRPKTEQLPVVDGSQEISIEASPSRESEERRSRKTMFDRIRAVDTAIFTKIDVDPGNVFNRVSQIEALESLAMGKQKERKRLGDAGVNAIMRMKIERDGGGEIVGFMKQKSGEAYFDKDGTPLIYSVSDDQYFRNEGVDVDPGQRAIAQQWSSDSFKQEYAVQMAKAYGVPPEEFEAYKTSLEVDRFGPRIDIPPEGFIAREVAMSRIDMLCEFDVIPPTAARKIDRLVADGHGGTKIVEDIASVQEGVSSTSEENPARYLSAKEFEAMNKNNASEWSDTIGIKYTEEERKKLEQDGRLPEPQESMARLATLDWLMGSQDRHFENMFIDPVSGKVTGIDNGLHSGRARDLVIKHGREEYAIEDGKRIKRKSDPTEGMRQLRSIPLEILGQRPELKLGPKDQEKMGKIYKDIMSGGPQKEVIEQVYKMMFPDRREARVQMGKFIARLKYIADHGRPGLTSTELFPIGALTKDQHEESQIREN